jgi:hypothetical protein
MSVDRAGHSGLPRLAEILRVVRHVSKVPISEVAQLSLRKQQLPQLEIIPTDRLLRECEFSSEM